LDLVYARSIHVNILRTSFLSAFFVIGVTAFADPLAEFFPTEPDNFVGNYSGRWEGKVTVDPELHAQVIALGNDTYRIRFVPKLFLRTPIVEEVEAKSANGRLAFSGQHVRGEISAGRIIGERTRGSDTFDLKKAVHTLPTMGRKAPEGAKALGKDAWQAAQGWEFEDSGVITVTPKGGYLTSKEAFKDLEMHIEFRTPFMPAAPRPRSAATAACSYPGRVRSADPRQLRARRASTTTAARCTRSRRHKVNACAPARRMADLRHHLPRAALR
jgi:hypothetical protein